jgi:hypothetical protein
MPRQFHIPEQLVQDVMAGKEKPSAYSPYLSALHNRHVIGINNAYRLGDWIDMLFFGDCGWYLVHRLGIANYPVLKITCCARFANRSPHQMEGIRYLSKDHNHKNGISPNPSMVSWNGNSGAAAISLAVHTGVKRIILLGFDMSLDDNNTSHWFGAHKKGAKPPFARHLVGFPAIASDAKALGIEIVNASPKSAIKVFKRCSVDELLGYSQAVA